MIENLHRWVFVSLASYVKGVATGLSLPSVVDGVEERTSTYDNAPVHVEIRITNLTSREPTAGYIQLTVDCTIVIHSQLGDNRNRYDVMRTEGAFADALDVDIATYRKGNGTDDDQSFLGCLIPRTSKNDGIRTLQFGQLNAGVRATQSVVAVRYDMEIDDG